MVIKTLNKQSKKRRLKGSRKKLQVTHKAKPMRITPDCSMETIKARRSWSDALQTQMPGQAAIPNKTINHN